MNGKRFPNVCDQRNFFSPSPPPTTSLCLPALRPLNRSWTNSMSPRMNRCLPRGHSKWTKLEGTLDKKRRHHIARDGNIPSSETQGQLVGTTGFSWAKVYTKSGRAPGHLLLPNEFQKRLKSRLLIGQKNFFWPISEEEQLDDSHVFLHEAVFLIERRNVQREHYWGELQKK